MKTYSILQEGAGVYEIEAGSEDEALREMAEGIVETLDNDDERECAFLTTDREEMIERAMQSLSIIED